MSVHCHQMEYALRIGNSNGFYLHLTRSRSAVDGKIVRFSVNTEASSTANTKFDIWVNGVSISSSVGYTVNSGQTSATFSVPGVSISKGDLIQIVKVNTGGVGRMGPTTNFQVDVDDGKPLDFGGTSESEITIGTGTKVFTVEEDNLAYSVGSRVMVSEASTPSTNWMLGAVTGYNRSTKEITVNVTEVGGTGEHSDWSFSLAGGLGPQGPPGSSALGSSDISVSTTSLDPTEEGNFTVALGRTYVLQKVTTTRACRVRVYRSAAFRTADVSRPPGTDPVSPHGVIVDLVLTTAGEFFVDLSPFGSSAESPRTETAYLRVQNRSMSAGSVGLTFRILKLEV